MQNFSSKLVSQIITRNVGDKVTVLVNRNGESIELTLVLGEKPQQAS